MEGDVWAESEIDKGSTFHFTAWVVRSPKEAALKQTRLSENTRDDFISPPEIDSGDTPETLQKRGPGEEASQGQVLLVEDNSLNRKLARYMLTRAGYDVDLAVNGKVAVEMFTAQPDRYDLILMDVQMPEMDGIEATRIIRGKGFGSIPIIAMTAQALKGDRDKCINAGMNDFISKPIKRDAVFRTVQAWTSKRK
jgi:CheY-like chemotaxis protein